MKKLIFSILLISILLLSACSKEADTTAFPDDLVVVLPDGQELALYMPHDDAAEILGPADSVRDRGIKFGHLYSYESLGLGVGYKDDLLVSLIIDGDSPCSLKSGLSRSSGKSDFVKHGFTEDEFARKWYSISDGHYLPHTEAPEDIPEFLSFAQVDCPTAYSAADSPDFVGYDLYITDYYCIWHGCD